LIGCTLTCGVMTAALAFVRPDQPNAVLLALTLFVAANVAFEIGLVFYNAFLPSIVSDDRLGRVSGYGWALGYAGGLVCLVLALPFAVGDPPPFGVTTEAGFHVRATNLLVAGWFLLFSVPLFIFVRDDHVLTTGVDLRSALTGLKKTVTHLRRYREVGRFLVARLIYNDGLVTVFAFGGIYANGTFGFTIPEVIVFGIVLNVVAGLGAWIFGFVDDRIGGKKTILISLVFLSVAALLAAVAPDRLWFWVAGILVGFFLGPNQSASRSLMARFVPREHESEFFGFFAFSGKATAFMGPWLLGLLSEAYSQRAGMASVLVFFFVGGLFLLTVDEEQGIRVGARQTAA
jgi:UMF1 family MFS transporter